MKTPIHIPPDYPRDPVTGYLIQNGRIEVIETDTGKPAKVFSDPGCKCAAQSTFRIGSDGRMPRFYTTAPYDLKVTTDGGRPIGEWRNIDPSGVW